MKEQKRMGRRKGRRLKHWVRMTLFGLFLAAAAALVANLVVTEEVKEEVKDEVADQMIEPVKEPVPASITVSAAGDFTLGTDETFTYAGSFPDEAERSGLSHFTEGLDGIFENDDVSTVNLETTLTEATEKAVKKFRFKGDPAYTQILNDAGIESVNLANNHIFDYLEQGYEDTKANLKAANIGYFGYDDQYVTEVKGVKVWALGYEGWEDTAEIREQVETDIDRIREEGVSVIVVHFHWGVERSYVPEQSQRTLAQFTVDAGADLVVGHHPHVVQGIEEYNGKFIVYSLGNFMFGGNRNPADKDTYVFQQTFHLEDGELTDKKDINVVPFSISSRTDRNDYQPTRLDGPEKERVMDKIIDVSDQIEKSDWVQYMDSEPSR
ncbi:CapA family protein [Domibacillus iocasae]|uniref:Capsular biosynthesis protein n=1 Tax=Domibacillus iocasae TaxID=1714016 RepID=A0A1E7DU85_9BACI|nr:CapA family protein [Domibacillus iocasae]OES46647.1 capsular biosynthesis protein [Domibacillus iocasae]